MNILYISISFNKNNNNLYNNLIDSLLQKGHKITVARSDSTCEKSFIENETNNYKILNVKTGNPFEKNLIKKGLNQILLELFFNRAIKEHLSNDCYDLILYETPPVTLSGVVSYCKKYYNAKTFLMLKDIFPQNAVDLEMFSKTSPIYFYFRKKEEKYYKLSDYIGCMSQGNVEFVKLHNPNVDPSKLHVFYNSIKIEDIDGLSFNDNKTVFIFGGNLGKPQNFPLLLRIIEKLKDYDKAEFQIIGKGTEQQLIKGTIIEKRLTNLKYEEYLPAKEYEERLKSADVGLISLDYRFTIPNIPSKFQSYLKLKKPVLAITDEVTDLKEMILKNDCGWWCSAIDEDAIVEKIKEICEAKDEQVKKGTNGHKLLINEFDVEKNSKIIEDFMTGI